MSNRRSQVKNKAKTNSRYVTSGKVKDAYKKQERNVNGHMVFGFILFLIIFIYLIFVILSFTFEKKINYTFAEFGQIVDAETFTGLVIRDESVVTSNSSGKAHFFTLEGSKTKQSSTICLVDHNNTLGVYNNTSYDLTNDEESFVNDQFINYIKQSQVSPVGYMYEGADMVINATQEIYSAATIKSQQLALNDILSTDYSNTLSTYTAPETGVVSFYLDGYEYLSIDGYTIGDLVEQPIDFTYTLQDSVSVYDPLFKVVDNYEWYIVSEISEQLYRFIQTEDGYKSSLSIFFNQEGISTEASILDCYIENDHYYMELTLNRYMENFLTDRYVTYTVTYENYEGLKIPNSAVLTKEFVSIPINAFTEIDGRNGVNIVVENQDYTQTFVPISFYYESEDMLYIPLSETLTLDMTIIYKDNGEDEFYPLQSSNRATHEGVYVINKGYAGFALIETLTYNDDYRIVKTNTPYGVLMYDRIASDASTVTENELIN